MLEENTGVITDQPAAETTQVVESSSPSDQGTDKAATDNADAGQGDQVPFGKHPRWIKMQENNRTLQSQIKETQAQLSQLDGAKQLDAWLRKNPDKIQIVMDMMNGKTPISSTPEANKPDPYADFDPVVAERFRKQDALEKRLADMEAADSKRLADSQMSDLQRNVETAEANFSALLTKDGFVDKDGNGDSDLVDLISKATLGKLAEQMDDPRYATKEQVATAYAAVTKGLSAHQKYTMKKTVTPDVPLSGSNRGSIPQGKTKMSEEDRIASIVNSI